MIAEQTNYQLNKKTTLIEQVAQKNKEAFTQLYKEYGDMIYGTIYRIVGPSEADDVYQKVLLQIWNTAHTFNQERGRLATWLIQISRTRAIDRLRQIKSKKFREQPIDIVDEENHKVESTEQIHDNSEKVNQVLKRLNSDQKQVIKLSFYEGYSHTDIAEKLNLPLSTIKGRIRMALKHLKKHLTEKCIHG